jgi:dinuclear metal center YbgI/SA1388 family protein
MILLEDIITTIEKFSPLAFQEDYDNSGLQTGSPEMEIKGIVISLDVTEAVIDEAIAHGENLIVTHHPVTLQGIKKFNGKSQPERILIKAIKHDIAIYSAHTTIDSVEKGVSQALARKLGLNNIKILKPREDLLLKLVTFVPQDHAENVRNAIFNAGGGFIGNYDHCSYNLSGQGSFMAHEGPNPFVGKKGEIHFETEVRIETIIPAYLQNTIKQALFNAHPYEEVAYDLYPLKNQWPQVGLGAIGELPEPTNEKTMLQTIKEITKTGCIRHTQLKEQLIKKVALCGGAGSFLLAEAIKAGADLFVSADFKYHQFAEADNRIVIADIGHYESEQFTKEVFFELLTKNFPNFAIRLANVSTNPIKYF